MLKKKKRSVKHLKNFPPKKKRRLKLKRKPFYSVWTTTDASTLSFNNFFLNKEMAELWGLLDRKAKEEWEVLLTGIDPFQFIEEDFIFYELPFLKEDYDKKKKMLSSSVAIDTFGEKVEQSYDQLDIIPDTFHFDSFFFENVFLFLFLLFFFSKVLFYFFFVLICSLYSHLSFAFLEGEGEQLGIFSSEMDLSHYTFNNFSFIEAPTLSSLFFSSDVWNTFYKKDYYNLFFK